MLERGEAYSVRVDNRLDELTTIHWHGLDVQADADGGPRQPIDPGEQWNALFDIHQPAATAWYHPHAMGTTASQVAMGLAGMIIIRDTTTEAARRMEQALPHTYGADDLPVIVQDRRLNVAGENSYRSAMPDIMLRPPHLVDPGTDLSDLPRRRFVLETRGMMSRTPFTINGKVMNINRIDEQVQLGRLEIWEIENAGPMNITHSFHVHSAAFQVVGFAGEPPPAVIAGRKDTVIVPAGATVEIAVRFDEHLALMASPRRT